MMDSNLHRHSVTQLEESRPRMRWGSITNDKSFLDIFDADLQRLPETSLTLAPVNSNIYARRHSAHSCPVTEDKKVVIPPPVPRRAPAVPKRTHITSTTSTSETISTKRITSQPPPIPPVSKNRVLPPIPPVENKPRPPIRNQTSSDGTNVTNIKKTYEFTNASPKRIQGCQNNFDYSIIPHNSPSKILNSHGPPPVTPKQIKSNIAPSTQNGISTKVSYRQDSGISSDSFSQTSSPSYTTKTMETPLLPPKTPIKNQNSLLAKALAAQAQEDANANNTIIKSASTPASLQTIVKFHNGSNMSLHHRIMRDMRRPSSHYSQRVKLKFRFAQIIINAVALFAIGAGMAAYFKAFPTEIHIFNKTVITTTNTSPVIETVTQSNPAPGICLPVIVNFCQQHKIPYNFTVFPNYMGQFGQRDAQQELEVYDAVVNVRCYELAALFLCSLFVPKCGPGGALVRPCRNLCYETKKRCGFFLDVFGLTLPDYLECRLFPETPDPNICVGYEEVKESRKRAQSPVCPTGFQCDVSRCIPKDWQCDGHVDCKDQSDELNCKKCAMGMIHCGANRCITQEHMCDGKVDCPWGQDERNCLRLSERNGDEGKGQLEVYRPDMENWVPACVQHWDQHSFPKYICSLLGYSNVTHTQLIGATESPRPYESSAWHQHKSKRSRNLIRQFGSCNGTNYPTVEMSCGSYICGKARKSYAEKRRTTRIIGGTRSKPGDWPFLAALLGGPEEIFYCAGVLIADQWVLTASHCVGNHSDVSGWTIQLGITRRHSHAFYGQKMKVKRVVPHPMYNLGIAHDNDVALFQLSSRVTFHEHLLPVCLPKGEDEENDLKPGTLCTVIGWGKKEDNGMSEYEPEINQVEVPILNRDLCNSWLEHRDLNVTNGMICAGYKEGGKDACQPDFPNPALNTLKVYQETLRVLPLTGLLEEIRREKNHKRGTGIFIEMKTADLDW
ncbi:hypothetical protein HHI36_023423 [Cryptolaemus montrouzieri]|uniref:Atrial natriuretic peptide-converting enzyme n=1 Tax=Cryptolaemus montrouzieri TaxID=559131 RepID=A0ABD2PH34_9CUCU